MEALTLPTERWPLAFRFSLVASSMKTDSRSSLAIRQVTFISDRRFLWRYRNRNGGINGIVEFGGFALVSFMHGFNPPFSLSQRVTRQSM